MNPIIEVHNVTKAFPTRRGPRDLRGRGGIGDWLTGRKENRFTALQDITLTVSQGESLGIIGRNGSGKSTLLSIIAGVTLPTEGRVIVRGRIASLLELGAGFNPVLTGRENIYLNAGLLGMRHAQVNEVFDAIVKFSGIEDFIDQPVETYSSGMYVRIGFAVAVHTNPDIFLADEVLAVGDAEFQRRCLGKIGELREQGKTIVFVSHDLGVVNTLCGRVILLDKGRMIQRDTPQKTIMYYLRQVGHEKGVHAFSVGDYEGIHCDGRISLFQHQEEISAPEGFRMELAAMGQRHLSTDAMWTVTESSPSGCTVVGRMMRLPILLLWNMRLEEGRFIWNIAIEVERECSLNEIGVQFFLPVTYIQWIYNDISGDFPTIAPTDTNWNVVVAPEMKTPKTATLPDENSTAPPVVFQLNNQSPFFGLYWANTEYITGSRVLCASARFPQSDSLFPPGRHSMAEIILEMDVPRTQILEHVYSDRTIRREHLTARFEHGQIRLFWDDVEITTYVHVYTSMLIAHLWNDSQNLYWSDIVPIAGGIMVRGASRRFPYSQEWEITAGDDGLSLRIWLETNEEIEAQEYHTSIALPSCYTRWRTEFEEGSFPEYDRERPNWVHCNTVYAPGSSITAFSSTPPPVSLKVNEESPPMRMTALNTSLKENARVLQALRPSEQGRMRFSKGRHLYFSGTIQVLPDEILPQESD